MTELTPNGRTTVRNAINALSTNNAATNRDAGAAIRDAIEKLKAFKDQDGSVLYLITGVGSDGSTLELDVADDLINNRIQLVVVEVGADTLRSLAMLEPLSSAKYYITASVSASMYFTPINTAIAAIVENPIETGRRSVI